MESHIVPTAADQPTNSFYNAGDPADYAPEADLPSGYPSVDQLEHAGGHRPHRGRAAHGLQHAERLRHALDPRRRQLLRLRPARRRHVAAVVHQHVPARAAGVGMGDGAPAVVGGLPVGRGHRRRVSAALHHRTLTRAAVALHERAGRRRPARAGDVLGEGVRGRARRQRDRRLAGGQGRADGRLPALRDVRQVLQADGLHQPDLPRGHRLQRRPLPHVLVLRVGRAIDAAAGWAWRIGSSHNHFGYQNPMAAHALTTMPALRRARPTACATGRPASGARSSSTAGCSRPTAASPAAPRTAGAAATRRRRAGVSTFYAMFYRRTRSTWIPAAIPGSASRPGRWSAWPSTTT